MLSNKAMTIPQEVKRTSKVYFAFIGVLALLALVNYTHAFEKFPIIDEIFGTLFALSFLLIALPATLIFISTWLKFLLSKLIPQKFSKFLGVVILVLLIHLSFFIFVKTMLPIEDQAKVLMIGFKLTILIVIIALLWMVVYGTTIFLVQCIARIWHKVTGKGIYEILAVSLYAFVFISIYQLIRYFAEHSHLVEWLFGQKIG